jgi:pyruvate dehydrogenase E2 component (dihydrolipoamide acetyltransferase)
MALEFKLPDIGEGVVEGEIVRWLVQEGDVLREDQPMVEVMTDKATVEIPTPKAGRVERIMVPAGKLCAVGQVMVVIATEGGASHTAAPAAPAAPTYHAPAAAAPAAAPSPVVSVAAAAAPIAFDPNRKVLATPATRQMARSIGVDIRTVSGTGPGGRITKADVAAAAQRGRPAAPPSAFAETRPAAYQPAPTPAPAPVAAAPAPAAPPPVEIAVSRDDERIPFRGVRKKIAENMLRSKQSAAHFTYVEECDVTDLVEVRKRAQKRAAERGIKLSFLPFIVKAVVSGLKKFPIVNSTHDVARDEIVLRKSYHIGVAAATDAGLIVPVVRDADKLSLFQIAERLEQLAERTRTGKASREELTGSTFTISSLGKLGGVLATPIINFPEVAVLGVHKIKETPAVRDGQIVIRQVMNLSISLDHRVDGYEGAKFLQHVVSLLEDPTLLFMELT